VGQKDPKTKKEKAEASTLRDVKPLKFSADDRNWPVLMLLLQDAGPNTSVRLSVKHGNATRT